MNTCSECDQLATWEIEWGVVDVVREPRRPGQPVCNTHLGYALERRMPAYFRLQYRRRGAVPTPSAEAVRPA